MDDPRIDMRVTTHKVKTKDALGCSQTIVKKFGAIGVKIEGEDDHDEVNGAVTIRSDEIELDLYQKEQSVLGTNMTYKKSKHLTFATIDEMIKDSINK